MRVNFNYFISPAVFDYLVEAVSLVAREGWRLLPDYRFEPASGMWRHHGGPTEPPMRLTDVSYDADGAMRYPHHPDRAGESELAGYLDQARAVFAAAGDVDLTGHVAQVSADFDHLRWFDLPAVCCS